VKDRELKKGKDDAIKRNDGVKIESKKQSQSFTAGSYPKHDEVQLSK
jgi:hypothetical protein